jgi:hypothetical protein
MVLWSPLIAIGTYFALGAVVLGSRLLFPLPNAETAPTAAGSALVPANSEREERVAA